MCVTIFVGGIIGFKIVPSEYSYLSPTTYLSIIKFIHSFNSPIRGLIILICELVIISTYLYIIDFNNKRYLQLLKSYVSYIIYISLCIMGILSSAVSLDSIDGTIFDVWVMSFRGASAESFSYAGYFYYSIVYFGLVYLVNFTINNELDVLGFYRIIRFRNLEKWFWSWFKRILLTITFFLFLLLALSIIVGILTDRDFQSKITVFESSLYPVFYHYFINGFLQIVLYILFVFIVSWIRREGSHGIIVVSIFMILMLPGINQLGVIPVGLNSIVYLESYSTLRITMVLLITSLVVYSIIKYLFTRSVNR